MSASKWRSLSLWLVGVAYALLVFTAASRHVPWFDEAQSWLLARDSSLADLFASQLRYEGTPGLWHLLLKILIAAGLPYSGLSYVSAALALLGVAVFLWRAPFPLLLKLLFPFCYIPLFQYAVVARSYALIMPLLFGIAALYPERLAARRFTYCVLLALLANVSLHGALMAAFLIAEWLWNSWRAGLLPRRIGSLCAFAVLYTLLFLQLRLPSDLAAFAVDPAKHAALNRVLAQVSQALLGGAGPKPYEIASALVASSILLAFLYWFRTSAALVLFLGLTIPLLLLAAFRQAAYWHSGILFLVWIFALWIHGAQSRWQNALVAAIFAVQAAFGLLSVRHDLANPYSGSKAAAAYLRQTGEDRGNLYAIGFKPFALQPYFDRNLFAAQEDGRIPAFYRWSTAPDHRSLIASDLRSRNPDRIILSANVDVSALRARGYCQERRFEGAIWWKNAALEPDSYTVLSRCSPLAQAQHLQHLLPQRIEGVRHPVRFDVHQAQRGLLSGLAANHLAVLLP